MAQMIIGVFNNRQNAENAIGDLQNLGFNPKDISIIMKDTEEAQEMSESTGSHVASGAASGATTGGVVGALAGLLIGIGAIVVPGIGGLLIGGPVAAALGLTGAAASTASGAVTGILAGGLVGALTNLGVSEDEAKNYETQVKSGAILLMVPVNDQDNQVEQVKDILKNSGADQVNMVNNNL